MDPNVLHLAVAVALTLVCVVITALIWSRAQVKTVFWWIGLCLAPVAVYLLGLAPAVVGAWETLRLWWGTLTFTPIVWVGIVLAGLSALLMLGSRLIPSESRADRRAAREAKSTAAAPAAASRPASLAIDRARPAAPPATTGGGGATPAKRPASQATPSDDNLDEITQILRRRGIE